jgi:hypothetical protein
MDAGDRKYAKGGGTISISKLAEVLLELSKQVRTPHIHVEPALIHHHAL